MRIILLAVVLSSVLVTTAEAQSDAFVGDWEVTLIKTKTKYYPPWFEIKYPIRMSFREADGKLVGSYTDQTEFSDRFSVLIVQRNEVLFVVGGAGKKYEDNFMPVHRAILRDGVLHGYVTNEKQFAWIARKRKRAASVKGQRSALGSDYCSFGKVL